MSSSHIKNLPGQFPSTIYKNTISALSLYFRTGNLLEVDTLNFMFEGHLHSLQKLTPHLSTPVCSQFEKAEVQFEKAEAQFEKDEVEFEITEFQFEKDKTQIEKDKVGIEIIVIQFEKGKTQFETPLGR